MTHPARSTHRCSLGLALVLAACGSSGDDTSAGTDEQPEAGSGGTVRMDAGTGGKSGTGGSTGTGGTTGSGGSTGTGGKNGTGGSTGTGGNAGATGGSSGTGGGSGGTSQTYTTHFPLTENPISEGGRWINGGSVGLDWTDVATTPGKAFGDPSTGAYTDPIAVLQGTWGPDQTVTATVFCSKPTSSYYQEVEIHLRSSISAHSATGYEILYRCLTDGNAYTGVVRWNGPVTNFTSLANRSGSGYGVADGDTVSASIVGNLISVYRNGSLVTTATDSTYTTGSPGMGFNYGVGTTNADFGFTSFTVTAR